METMYVYYTSITCLWLIYGQGITYGSILGVDKHPFATGYRVLSHSHTASLGVVVPQDPPKPARHPLTKQRLTIPTIVGPSGWLASVS